MAKDNLFFKTLAEVHPRFHTPANAIVALCVWSALLTFAGKFSELASGVVFIGWIFYGLGAGAIFPLRAALGSGKRCLIADPDIHGRRLYFAGRSGGGWEHQFFWLRRIPRNFATWWLD